MTDPAIKIQYQIVERSEVGDRYLLPFDTRADAEKAKTIYEQWARTQNLRYRYEILERQELAGIALVSDPILPDKVAICVPHTPSSRMEYAIHWFNQRAFTDNARIQLLMKMLEATGFPSPSPQFEDLERVAIGMLQERDREVYLSHLRAQSEFKRMQMQVGIGIKGDGDKLTATRATIEEKKEGK